MSELSPSTNNANSVFSTFKTGLESIERYELEQSVDDFPHQYAFNGMGESPKEYLQDVFALAGVNHGILASLKPRQIPAVLQSPAGYVQAMTETLQFLQQKSAAGALANPDAVTKAIGLVQENIDNSRLLMSHRLLLLRA